ncbi:Cyclic di-GMP phosphodiesterase Gmr [Marinomonas gallaica]|uniref:Cyclic di-GMP phosphodiesterase Gmr n=1 Tax=Marinomonas gallaica TaxID=1806667 RepID=A0A1C3JMV8_9GAMM|nr:EAL domain-containing protein [Marinomonas gallaica]SBT16513.1 Cyclic di-GMP phosphodiesterase Gmr [Marinomonas gallaica]SBT20229.1 Cyclic di-GMP phosphodiesterase Gmr [Marinomonas gallaica]
MLKRIVCFFCIVLPLWAHGESKKLNLVILSYNPDVSKVLLFQSIVDDLTERLPNYDINFKVSSAENLSSTIERHQYDLMLLDPVHYLKFRSTGRLSGALLTLRRGFEGKTTSLMGGVIFTRRDNQTIRLDNLYQYPVAATAPTYLENYTAQIYELKSNGFNIPSVEALKQYADADQVVDAVLSKRQETGFVRSGVLEKLVQQGRIEPNAFKILNEQNLAGYPFSVSTRLFPEWAFVAKASVDADVTREVTAALLNMKIDRKQARDYGLYGFVPSLDYLPVELMLKEFSLPPYDDESLGWIDFLKSYAMYFLLINMIALSLIFLSWNTFRQNKHLARLIKKEKQAQELLTRNNKQLDALLSSSPTVIYSLDPEYCQLQFISSNCYHLYGKTAEEVKTIRNWWQKSIHDDDLIKALATFRQWRVDGCLGTLIFSYRISRQGDWIWVEDRLQALRNDIGEVTLFVGAHSDVSERHLNEEQLELWASVFANAREGIAITNPKGDILDVNSAFSRITGYSRFEIIGQNPRVLNSGRQSKDFYQEMWRQIVSAGFWEGEIWNKRKNGSIYAQNLTVVAVSDVLGNVSHYISLFSDITRQKRNEEQLEHIAYFDSLTGLPNRTNLTNSLDIKIRNATIYGTKFALAFLDLDGFKEVNDTFGHDTGDLLLVDVAKRMRETLGSESIVARFGGDEFVLLVPILQNSSEIEPQLQCLLDGLAQPFKVSGVTLHISASIGVTFYPQNREVEADQLIRQADQAMYQAKISGRNRLKAFDLSQEDILVEQHRFYEELQQAYESEQFRLYYQPKVNMRTKEVFGYEALIRWQHPTRGILAPALFLPALTNQPLELEVGNWVIKTALAQLWQWQQQGYNQTVSVNLASYQLQQGGFIAEMKGLLAGYPRSVAESLELEILETSAIEDLATVSGVIEACKEMGVKLSLDDFGTGYSTLSHLKELSVDILKIDHGFVCEMLEGENDLAIIKGVIGFADAFSLDVIAEGVETEDHAKRLIELGCELGQGYYISRPMPAEKVLEWYDQWRPFDYE